MSAVAGYAWATLEVADLERSVAWYRELFGLEVLMTNADTCKVADEDHFVYLVEPSSMFVIGLVTNQTRNGRQRLAPTRTGLSHLAIAVEAGALGEHLAHLDRLGIAYRGPTPWKTETVAELTNPDGIALLLFESSPWAGVREPRLRRACRRCDGPAS